MRVGRRARAAGVFLGLAALASASACVPGSAPDDDARASPAAAPQVSAELVQYRRDEALHQVQAKVTNTGDTDLVVERLVLELPGFDPVPPTEPEAELWPGRRADLPVVYGPARCDGARPVPTSGVATARLDLAGVDEPVVLEAPDDGLLEQLATQECAQRAVTDAVPLAFTDAWTPVGTGDDLAVTGALRVGPVDVVRAARLAGIDGTTLFGVSTSTPLPLALAGAAVDVPVTVAPQRCDPHAVAESKRGYAFRVAVSLDGAEPVLVTVDVDPAQQPVLQAALLERCGLA